MQRHIAYLDIFKHQRCAIANVFSVTEGFCLQWVPVRPQLLVGGPCHAAAFGDPGGKRQVLPLPLSCMQAGWTMPWKGLLLGSMSGKRLGASRCRASAAVLTGLVTCCGGLLPVYCPERGLLQLISQSL